MLRKDVLRKRRFSASTTEQILHQPAAKPLYLSSDATATARWLNGLAILVLLLVGAIAAVTFRDYGLGWDDYTHWQYGQLLVSLYSSGFADQRALSFVNLYMYGGGSDLIATVAAKVLPFGPFETRRLVEAAIGVIGLFVTWRLGRRVGGPLAGVVALILLAACPLYYGHMFINAKDAPFAVTNALGLLGIVRAFEEYPRAKPPTIALCGLGVGLAIGTRVLGGFTVVDALVPLLVILAVRWRASGIRPALGECGSYLYAFIPGVILAYLVMGLVWPWSVVEPLNPLHAAEYFSSFFDKPWRELFAGRFIPVTEMPRDYVTVLMAVTVPELLLLTGIGGMIGAIIAIFRSGQRGPSLQRRAVLMAIVLAATVPIVVTIATRPGLYNGIRHFVFLMPPLAVLGGLACAWLTQRLRQYGSAAVAAGAVVFIVGIASPIVEMVRLHPYQYTYFNRFAGGVPGARQDFMVDYWGLAMTQASHELRALLAERHETPPNGQWTVAVCGPHPAVAVGLGPEFTAVWDPKGADFAMMMGEYYCAKLDAPLILQIVREGVVYASVYDIRGRSIANLLTMPPLSP